MKLDIKRIGLVRDISSKVRRSTWETVEVILANEEKCRSDGRIDNGESTNSIVRWSHIRYLTTLRDQSGRSDKNDIKDHSRGKNIRTNNLLLIYLALLLYCCFVMHLNCLNHRLYSVSLRMVLEDGKFMILFLFVYRHVTSSSYPKIKSRSQPWHCCAQTGSRVRESCIFLFQVCSLFRISLGRY